MYSRSRWTTQNQKQVFAFSIRIPPSVPTSIQSASPWQRIEGFPPYCLALSWRSLFLSQQRHQDKSPALMPVHPLQLNNNNNNNNTKICKAPSIYGRKYNSEALGKKEKERHYMKLRISKDTWDVIKSTLIGSVLSTDDQILFWVRF